VRSGVALLEAVVKEYEETIGMAQPAIVAASKRASSLFQTLTPDEKEQVIYRLGWMILSTLAKSSSKKEQYSTVCTKKSHSPIWQ
jgi:hypothetical protein